MNIADEADQLRKTDSDACREHEELFRFYQCVSSIAGGQIMEIRQKFDRMPPLLTGHGPSVPETPAEVINRVRWEINIYTPASNEAKAEYITQIDNTYLALVRNGMEPEAAEAAIDSLTSFAGKQFDLDESQVEKIVGRARELSPREVSGNPKPKTKKGKKK